MKRLMLLVFIIVGAGLLLGLTGCGGQKNVPTSPSSTRPTGPTPPAATAPASTP